MSNLHQITQVIFRILKDGLVKELRADGQAHIAEWLHNHTIESAIQELSQELIAAITTMTNISRRPTGDTKERQVYNAALKVFATRAPWLQTIGELRELEERIKANIARPGDLFTAASRVMSNFTSMLRLFGVQKGDDRLYDDLQRNIFDVLSRSQGR